MLLDNSKNNVGRIFSHEVFKHLDKQALLDKYDISGGIYGINSVMGSFNGQQPQEGMAITSIPPEGIVINNPGTYTFSNNITWNAPNMACSAITIQSDNVVLNMNGYSLTAVVQDNSQFIVGIAVTNAQIVSILNGKLVNMCFYGISAQSVSNFTIENLEVDGISFNNLQKRLLTPSGIYIDKAKYISIANTTIHNLNVTSDSCAGIQILETVTGNISGCSLNNFVNNDGAVQGYSYLLSEGLNTTNCTSSNFQSFFNGNIETSGHTVLGFVPIFCVDLFYGSCAASNMTGCCDDCHGMSVFLDAFVSVTNFTASNVIDGVAQSNSGAKSTGLEVYGVEVTIMNSSVQNIMAINPQDKQGTGFSATGALIKFVNCVAKNVIVIDEKGGTSPALGYGTGFGWAPDPRPMFGYLPALFIEYNGCTAVNCQVGFDTWFHIDSKWANINAVNCAIPILVEPGATRVISGNACSECNPPISTPLINIASGNVYP